MRFLGGQQDVRPYYGAADCFALPTLYDPMPNAALEALACGLPVVTSTTSGAAELIRHGVNGHVCPATDVAALANHLDALIGPERLEPLAVRATVTRLRHRRHGRPPCRSLRSAGADRSAIIARFQTGLAHAAGGSPRANQ